MGFLKRLFGAREKRSNVIAQSAPNLSGTWALDKPRVKIGRRIKSTDPDITLMIIHHEPEIKIVRKKSVGGHDSIQELVYYTDSRGERNPGGNDNEVVESKTQWSSNRLISNCSVTLWSKGPSGDSKIGNIDMTVKWELSRDGTTLDTFNICYEA